MVITCERVTLVSGRHRRLTIIECPQEMSAMLDLAKIADLVLLLIDASYGFELETFEFINILQALPQARDSEPGTLYRCAQLRNRSDCFYQAVMADM
eukprot:Skav216286  [mRNA]  locus=scaffold4425:62410:65574:- [translate_table: standard]